MIHWRHKAQKWSIQGYTHYSRSRTHQVIQRYKAYTLSNPSFMQVRATCRAVFYRLKCRSSAAYCNYATMEMIPKH